MPLFSYHSWDSWSRSVDALSQSHCGVGSVKTVRSGKVAAGRVISQSPSAGRILAPGTKVKLTVSRGPSRPQ